MNKIWKALLLSGLIAGSVPAFSADLKFALGLGAPYGILGGNLNVGVAEKAEVFAGLGMALAAVDNGSTTDIVTGSGPSYAVGGRYYLTGNVRLTAGYGIVGGIVTGTSSSVFGTSNLEMEEVAGAFAGIGFKLGGKNNSGIGIDLLYIDTSKMEDKANELELQGFNIEKQSDSNIKLAIGYRF